MGSVTVAAWIAHIVFWLLLARAWFELGRTHAAVFALLWIGGYVALRSVNGGLFVMPFVAILDVGMLLLLTRAGVD
jgi:hypothetical protein